MTRNFTFFFAAFVLSMPLWWGFDMAARDMEEFFLARELRNPEFWAAAAARQAALERRLLQAYPLAAKQREALSLEAAAGLSMLVKEHGTAKVLFEKQSNTPLPIASLSKLMTAFVALRSYPPNYEISVTQEILDEQGEAGFLRAGEVFTVKDFLHLALMESSNDAAAALAQPMGREVFVRSMNEQARALGLQHTSFQDPTGLSENISSADDLAQLAMRIRSEYPQVFDILSQQELDLYTPQGTLHHTIKNTNLLLKYEEWPTAILGGKTGFTPAAKETLLLLVESPDEQGYIINVILGSENRFGEMRQLMTWILQAYQWTRLTPV